jgi:phosphonate transport system ATP-binding protein
MALIEAVELRKVYPNGTVGLDGLNVKIERGEMVGVLGRSGAGKTTFFRLLNGSIRPSGGQLKVLDQSLEQSTNRKALRHLRAGVAVVYQNSNVIPSLSAMQNVLLGRLGRVSTLHALRSLFLVPENERLTAAQALHLVGLADKLYTRADELSGGQQQRIAIARAIVQRAPLVLGDEPIASVDIRTAGLILDLFKRLNQELGVTVLLNLHQVDFALQYCQRLLVLSHGKLVYDGAPDGIKNIELYADDPAKSETEELSDENQAEAAINLKPAY